MDDEPNPLDNRRTNAPVPSHNAKTCGLKRVTRKSKLKRLRERYTTVMSPKSQPSSASVLVKKHNYNSSPLCYCTTELLSSCWRPPSIRKTRFPRTHQAELMPNLLGRYLFTISPDNFFLNFAFLIFTILFSFSLTWDHMEEKTSNDISSEIS